MIFKENLEKIDRELDVAGISLARIKELSEEASCLLSDPVKSKDLSIEEVNIINSISKKSTEKVLLFAKKWQNKEIEISEEELKIMEEFHENLTNVSKSLQDAYVKSKASGEKEKKMYQYMKFIVTNEKAIGRLIKEEKTRRQNPSNGNDNNGNNKDKGEGNHPSPNNTEIDKQIANLQSQIKTLENKIKNTPNSDTNRQNYNQEIQSLKAQLKEKEKEKEKENKQSQQPSNNNFPTGWVVGGGILVGILLLVIIILASKKRN